MITIPAFVDELAERAGSPNDDEGWMRLAIALSAENVAQGGAPFGAVVVAGDRLVAAGVNRVLSSGMTIAHAEIVTLMRSQQVLNAGLKVSEPLTLYTSTEPCCQCYGAVVWAGISRMVCGATTRDAESIGFDEGPKPPKWREELERRGISVTEGVCTAEARVALKLYSEKGGPIFGSGAPPLDTSRLVP
jgi:tRNA(Arg) A34 adenosine deaminase TadA